MSKFSRRLIGLSLFVSIILAPLSATRAADFKREVIYQIITDRFFDGSSSNNNPNEGRRALRARSAISLRSASVKRRRSSCPSAGGLARMLSSRSAGSAYRATRPGGGADS